MLDKEALAFLRDELKGPIESNVPALVPDGWTRMPPIVPTTVPVEVSTLAAIVDLLSERGWMGTLPPAYLMLHVLGATEVKISGAFDAEPTGFRRKVYARSVATVATLPLNQSIKLWPGRCPAARSAASICFNSLRSVSDWNSALSCVPRCESPWPGVSQATL